MEQWKKVAPMNYVFSVVMQMAEYVRACAYLRNRNQENSQSHCDALGNSVVENC